MNLFEVFIKTETESLYYLVMADDGKDALEKVKTVIKNVKKIKQSDVFRKDLSKPFLYLRVEK
jgi:hypothetical protein